MLKILISLLTVVLVSVSAIGATSAYFSDTETSSGNTFAAGSLDLNVDGQNANIVKFNVSNMKVGSQNIGTWRLRNVGSINGYLDLQDIVVTSYENGCVDPESDASDPTCGTPGEGEGELQNLVSLSKLFWDTDCNGWVGAGEETIYNGKVGSIASDYDLNVPLNAGEEKCVTGQFNWWNNGADDNLGHGDSMTLDILFELAQTAGQ